MEEFNEVLLGGLLGHLLEFQNVFCRHFLDVSSELHFTVRNALNSDYCLSLFHLSGVATFCPCPLSAFSLAGPVNWRI